MKKYTNVVLMSALLVGGVFNTTFAAPDLGNKIDFASKQLSDEANLRSYYEASKYRQNIPQSAEVKYDKKEQVSQTETLSFVVKEIRVTKSELLKAEEISSVVQFEAGKTMNVNELKAIVEKINNLYLAKGIHTAQAVLPPQTIRDGVVYIRLIEGHFGEIRVEGNKRIVDGYIKERVSAKTGELSDLNQLQKDLFLYNNTNNHRLRAELVPGKNLGDSDLVLTVEEPENPWNTYFFVDNANQDDSGLYRVGFLAAAHGLSGADDSLIVSPVFTEGTVSGMVAYDAPISNKGTRATFSYSRNRVKIIDGTFEDYDIKANSNDASVRISHPLNVTALAKVDLFAEYHHKWNDTTYSGMEIADRATNSVKTGINARKYDKNGLWFAQLSVTGYETDDHYNGKCEDGEYYDTYLMRRQNLHYSQYLMVRAYGQYCDNKGLPSSEQFSVGGIATVRGYEESVLSGDKGWFASVEYGFPISKDKQSLRGFAFYDYGVAYNNYGSDTTRNYISSTGVGLEFFHKGWYGKIALGVPLKDSEDNIHSSKTRTHFYLQRNI